MTSSPPRIDAVLFDFGMVLTTPPDPASWERLKAVFSADEASFHKAYWKHRDDYDRPSHSSDEHGYLDRDVHDHQTGICAGDRVSGPTSTCTPSCGVPAWAR